MKYKITNGDLVNQDVEVIINAWNRNIIPWWLLLPQGVSGSIKKRAGTKPFKELAKYGSIPLGEARITGAGKLPYKAIIHVAGINMLWRSSQDSIRNSVLNAISLADRNGYMSIAIPIIGAGSGGFSESKALEIICNTINDINSNSSLDITIVKYEKQKKKNEHHYTRRV